MQAVSCDIIHRIYTVCSNVVLVTMNIVAFLSLMGCLNMLLLITEFSIESVDFTLYSKTLLIILSNFIIS